MRTEEERILERWKRKTPQQQDDEEHQLVVFSLGTEAFGVEIAQVKEIIKMAEITRMPNSPEFGEGVINLRGQLTTIMDLRKRMGMMMSEANEQTRIVVVEASGSTLGMIVDSAREVLRISGKDIDPPSAASTQAKYIQGVAKLDDSLLILLDLNKVLSEGEIVQIEKLQSEKATPQAPKAKTNASDAA